MLKTKTVKTKKIIQFLEQERQKRGLSLESWALEIGVAQSTYAKWMYGMNAPMAETLLDVLNKAGFKVLLKRKADYAECPNRIKQSDVQLGIGYEDPTEGKYSGLITED